MIIAQVLSLLAPGLRVLLKLFFFQQEQQKKLCLKPADMSDGGLNQSYPTDHSGHWQGRLIIT